jgi:hypothetical protein
MVSLEVAGYFLQPEVSIYEYKKYTDFLTYGVVGNEMTCMCNARLIDEGKVLFYDCEKLY